MVWLIGNKGMLGTQIEMQLKKKKIDFVASDRDVDITHLEAMEGFVRGKRITWIINCSAYTAVDKAESEEDTARLINAIGVENIALIANKIGAKLVHFSTDYVFDGKSKKPYNEDSSPNPLSAYGRTKLEGEELLTKNTDKYFIFRISWLYGIYGGNFVKTMIRLFKEKTELNIVNDQVGSPTYAGVLAENIVGLIETKSRKFGIYHYSDEGVISWYDFAVKIEESGFKYGFIDRKITLNPIPTEKYPTPAVRPANSAFDKTKVTTELGFKVVKWDKNLDKYFKEWQKLEGLGK